ncbi:hypothetical protein [Castellaniella sp.]|uniref:hypothetical protein n=1 Tax=Castellaniella sp. TaxID=1955812 RepID=UPI002AFE8C74|nr:hypothetical protein [Castellaniella sp.]
MDGISNLSFQMTVIQAVIAFQMPDDRLNRLVAFQQLLLFGCQLFEFPTMLECVLEEAEIRLVI